MREDGWTQIEGVGYGLSCLSKVEDEVHGAYPGVLYRSINLYIQHVMQN